METRRAPLPLVIAVPLVGAGGVAAWGSVSGSAPAAVEASFLALLVAGVGVAAAALAPRPGWEAVGGTFVAVLAALAVGSGPVRGASVAVALALGLGVSAMRAVPHGLSIPGTPVDLRLALATLVPLAIGLQLLARGSVLLDPPGLLRTLIVLVALPLATAGALAELARVAGGARALAVGGLLFAVGGGWWPGTVLAAGVLACGAGVRPTRRSAATLRSAIALGLLALLVLVAPRLGFVALAAGLAALVLPGRAEIASAAGVLCFLTALLAGYPWLRTSPLSTLAAAPSTLFARGADLLTDGVPVRLDAATPAYVNEFTEPRNVRRLLVDSTLVRAANLPAGTPVATLTVTDTRGEEAEFLLHVGSETGEWAARRPGVDAAAPPPALAWIDAGRFFGQRYRARWDLPAPLAAKRIVLRRRSDLPGDVEIHLFQLELIR